MAEKYPLRFYVGKKLSEAQLEMMDLIEQLFTDAGYSRNFVAMGVVNAYAESKLVPTEKLRTSKEDSAGLFMLNKKGGLGIGMPTGFQYPEGDSRKDPKLNAERILRAIKDSPATRAVIKDGLDDWRTLMDIWVHRIERPNGKHLEVVARLKAAAELFPQGIDGPPVDTAGALAWARSGSVQQSADVVPPRSTSPWVGRLVLLLGAGMAATWYARAQAAKGQPLPGLPRLER
jgi:hypothetical protein